MSILGCIESSGMHQMKAHTVSSAPELSSRTYGVFVFDDAITECSDRLCAILKRQREGLVSRAPLELSPRLQADGAYSSERWTRRVQAAREGG